MDAAYDVSRYKFSEETWGTIFAYESKLRSHKIFKRVRFKEGEKEAYIAWARYIIYNKKYINILVKECFPNEKFNKSLEWKTINYKLEMILNRNKYWLEKIYPFGLRFSHEDICEFLKLLKHSMECDCVEDFLSVPDVWYIARNIKMNWSDLEKR